MTTPATTTAAHATLHRPQCEVRKFPTENPDSYPDNTTDERRRHSLDEGFCSKASRSSRVRSAPGAMLIVKPPPQSTQPSFRSLRYRSRWMSTAPSFSSSCVFYVLLVLSTLSTRSFCFIRCVDAQDGKLKPCHGNCSFVS